MHNYPRNHLEAQVLDLQSHGHMCGGLGRELSRVRKDGRDRRREEEERDKKDEKKLVMKDRF